MRQLWSAIIVLTALGGCHRSGAVDMDQTAASLAVPSGDDALAAWVTAREARYTDITPKTEKTIIRAAPGRTPLSVVYIPGYGATWQDIVPMQQRVAEELGANLFLTRMRGHGRGTEGFRDASPEAWMEDSVEAMEVGRQLGEKVIVMGTSTGATLVTWLAAQQPEALAGVVLMSPNFGLRAKGERLLLAPGRRLLFRLVFGKYRVWQPTSEAEATYWTWTQPPEAMFAMMETVQHTRARTDLSQITVPALYAHTEVDTVVDHERGLAYFAQFGSAHKEVEVIADPEDASGHILAGQLLAPGGTEPMTERIVSFVRRAVGEAAP